MALNRANIQYVIIQMLDNALDAASVNDQRLSKVEIATDSNEKYAVIKIYNEGDMIPDSNLRSVFDPFYTTKDPGKGTGLGLSVCFSIVTECGGNMYAENSKGGVTFTVELPLENKFRFVKN